MTADGFSIGGSDAAAACGVNPYQSRVALWLEKTGRTERDETEAMYWGRKHEQTIFEALGERGYEIIPLPALPDQGAVDPDLPWRVGHPDGLTKLDERMALVSIKTTGQWGAKDWNGDAIPLAYQVQEQHYLSLWPSIDAVLFACLIAGQRLEIRTMRRDEKAIARIVELEEEFYEHLRTDNPPAPSQPGDSLLLHPTAESEVMRLLGDGWDAYRKAKVSAEQLRIVKEQHDRDLERLKAHVGDAATAISPHDEVVARWTSYQSNQFDKKAFATDHPHLADEYTTKQPRRRFTLD